MFMASALIVAAAVLFVGGFNYWQAREAIGSEARRYVRAVHDSRRQRLEDWCTAKLLRLIDLAETLGAMGRNRRPRPAESDSLLAVWDPQALFVGWFGLDGSARGQSASWVESDSVARLAQFHRAAAGEVVVGPIRRARAGQVVITLTAPVVAEGRIVGVAAAVFPTASTLQVILSDTTNLGRTGECFLVGLDTVMLTSSRFHEHPEPMTHKMPIPPVLAALRGEDGVMSYRGFLGHQVVGAYSPMPAYGWLLVTEVISREAYAPLRAIARNSILAGLAAVAVMLGLSLLLSRTWTKPVGRLAAAAVRVSDGDLAVRVPESSSGELGMLARQFNRMVEALAESVERIRQSQQRIVQAERLAAVGGLASAVVHEMRNPLSVVKMNLQVLGRKVRDDADAAEQVELALAEVGRLERMLFELLDYAKPISPHYVPTDLRQVVARVTDALGAEAASRKVELVAVHPDEFISIHTDPELLQRIIHNLALNAVQACSFGDEVRIETAVAGDEFVVTVSDTGQGMSPRVRGRLFEPFFTTREGGTGLGMANVGKFVEVLGGCIEVDSREGQGTTVKVTLPNRKNYG